MPTERPALDQDLLPYGSKDLQMSVRQTALQAAFTVKLHTHPRVEPNASREPIAADDGGADMIREDIAVLTREVRQQRLMALANALGPATVPNREQRRRTKRMNRRRSA